MTKNISATAKFLIESLPASLQQLATRSVADGFVALDELRAAAAASEDQEINFEEIVEFFKNDLELDIAEDNGISRADAAYAEDDDEGGKKSELNEEQSQVEDDDYEFYAQQLMKSNIGAINISQDSVQSYLRQIGQVQLLSGAGEIAIAQRIEVANNLVIYGLCENPMTIRFMLELYHQLTEGSIRLRNIVNLENMYSSEAELKSVQELDEALKASGAEDIEELEEDEDDSIASAEEEEEEEAEEAAEGEEGAAPKERDGKSSSGVSISAMEESLMPMVLELFGEIEKQFKQMEALQKQRMDVMTGAKKADPSLEKKYVKTRNSIFDKVIKIRLHDDRVAEIMDRLTSKSALLMGLEGKLMRLAVSMKLKREEFLEHYTGRELNKGWVKNVARLKNQAWGKFVKKYENEIAKIRAEILNIAVDTGQPTSEYKRVVEMVLRGQAEVARAKREMIEANLRLVIKSAKKSSNRGLGLELSDLVQDGNIGLMKAVDKFDYRLGYKFSTYATHWIQQGILRSIADQARTIRIPVHMIDNIHKIQRVTRQFIHKHGRNPTPEELSKIIYMPVEKIHKALKVNLKPVSLEAPLGGDEDSSRMEIIADENARDPFHSAVQKNIRQVFTKLLAELTPTEENVLRQRYGMNTNRTLTLEEVGEHVGVTRERIRQIQEKAIQKLRHPTRARKLRSFYEE
ncbi:MAG: RNA polymerase sigma factor RpoD [Rickettsiales bacterium]|jgi:RNA polymerase primary sigma factor|nr:RNA polymerase sigma factor RpoD [Rickettsiales bacterium]